MSQASGIQTLLKAEKEAHEIVDQARKYRTQRLKDAKKDASAEIAAYNTKKDAELKQFESQHSALNESVGKEAEAEIESELVKIEQASKDKKSAVVKLLIDSVTHPTPELHINA